MVDWARAAQQACLKDPVVQENAQIGPIEMEVCCTLAEKGSQLMKGDLKALGPTARSYDRILWVARTIANLGGVDAIGTHT